MTEVLVAHFLYRGYVKKANKPKPTEHNRYGDFVPYKTEVLISTIKSCLDDKKEVTLFVKGEGHRLGIKEALFDALEERNIGNLDLLNVVNILGHKNTNKPTDVSIALDGSGFDNTDWMEQSHVNIMLF